MSRSADENRLDLSVLRIWQLFTELCGDLNPDVLVGKLILMPNGRGWLTLWIEMMRLPIDDWPKWCKYLTGNQAEWDTIEEGIQQLTELVERKRNLK